MATAKIFEELTIWQMARRQCQQLNEFTAKGRFTGQPAIAGQIDRSSGSVMDNIAEGFDRYSRADFRHFLVVARGSNAEVRSQLYRALDKAILTHPEAEEMISANRHLGVSISRFINSLDKSGYTGKPRTGSVTEHESPYAEIDLLPPEFGA